MGTDLDAATQARLDRGYRMTELLKQGLYNPLHVTDQVMVIFAGTRGFVDPVPLDRVAEWEKAFLEFVHTHKEAFWKKLSDEGQMTDEIAAELEKTLDEFEAIFLPESSKEEETVTA